MRAAVLAGVLVVTAASFAQEPAAKPEKHAPLWTPVEPGPVLVHAANSPRGSVFDFITAARRGDYADAAKYLDLSQIPPKDRERSGPVLARQLKVVLDRNLWIDFDQISDAPDGNLEDGLPPGAEQIGTIQARSGAVNLILRRFDDTAEGTIWRFSPSLVARIPALYEEYGYGWIGSHVPTSLQRVRVGNIEAWQAIGVAIFLVAAWIVGKLLATVLARLALRIAKLTLTPIDDRLAQTMRRPARWAATLTIFAIGVHVLEFSVRATARADRLFGALWFITFILLVGAIAEAWVLVTHERLFRQGQISGAGGLVVMNRIAKVLLACIAAIGVFHFLGFNVTTLIAGLGVGGIAVALAAQKTIENLFGGLTLMIDQPVQIGDTCTFGAKTGQVEDIGLRSTRIRTPERTLITIPNGEFSNAQIENMSARDRLRFYARFGLRYETSPDQMRFALIELRRLFLGHPKVAPDPQVRLLGFAASSLDVEVQAFVLTRDPLEFAAIREDLLLRSMDVVAAAGTGFAFPSQTLYLGRDKAPDGEAQKAAEERIALLRAQNKLPFPDFTPEEVAEMTDKLQYPARGPSTR